jgi:hypothetical protein
VELSELDGLLADIGRRMRLRAAVRSALLPCAALLGAGLLLGLGVKMVGAGAAGVIALLLSAAAVLLGVVLFAILYALRPVPALAAAAELDRLAGLKERAASLVALRSGAVGGGALAAAVEADARQAVAGLRPAELRSRVAPLPAGARWLGAGLTALLAALLVPARGSVRGASLADLLYDPGLVPELESAAASTDGPAGESPAGAARKALVIVRAPAARSAEEAARRAEELENLAEDLRGRGQPDLAGRLLDAARALHDREAARGADAAGDGGRAAARPPGHDRYPEGYRDLLARYFGAGRWTAGGPPNKMPESSGDKEEPR